MAAELTEAMTYLDDNRGRLHEEVYVEMGRKLADIQNMMPQLFCVVFFTFDVVDDLIAMEHHETIAVAVEREEEGGVRCSRLLLKRGQCRSAWLDRTFPQMHSTNGSHDCLLVSMAPYSRI